MLCDDHMEKLKAELKRQGLEHTCAKSREESEAKIEAHRQDMAGQSDYDGIMDACYLLRAYAIEHHGPFHHVQTGCVICELDNPALIASVVQNVAHRYEVYGNSNAYYQ